MDNYVTYNQEGNLTGAFYQEILEEHRDNYLIVSKEQKDNWTSYKMNSAMDGLEFIVVVDDIPRLKVLKNQEINKWRLQANQSTFTHLGKIIACDPLSRSDIDAVAGSIALNNSFPMSFPMAWKAVDNTYVVLADTDAFRAMYTSMVNTGTANFGRSQLRKTALQAAMTKEAIDAIVW